MSLRGSLEPGSCEHVREVERRLRRVYGSPRHHNPEDPLDDLIFLVLSRMTQEIKYVRTYQSLRSAFADWEGVRDAPADDLEEILGDAGLAATKSRQITAILHEIGQREGRFDLSRLQEMSDVEVESYLTSLPGVATKTARCVMLYTLGRDVFPVDAHVWRICQRLGIAAETGWTDFVTKQLQEVIPKGFRVSLHMTMVSHGRAVCRAQRPACRSCVISDLCLYVTQAAQS